MFACAARSSLRHLDKLERLEFTNGWSDGMPVDPELDELVERDDEATVLGTPVISQLNFETIEEPPRRP